MDGRSFLDEQTKRVQNILTFMSVVFPRAPAEVFALALNVIDVFFSHVRSFLEEWKTAFMYSFVPVERWTSRIVYQVLIQGDKMTTLRH